MLMVLKGSVSAIELNSCAVVDISRSLRTLLNVAAGSVFTSGFVY